MPIEAITSPAAPVGPGPYSPAIRVGELVFVSAQSPIDPSTHQIQGTTIEEQTRRVLDNIKALLEAADTSLDKVVKVNAYLADPADYDRFNEVYASHLTSSRSPPAPPFR